MEALATGRGVAELVLERKLIRPNASRRCCARRTWHTRGADRRHRRSTTTAPS